jgi:hypothetical protein
VPSDLLERAARMKPRPIVPFSSSRLCERWRVQHEGARCRHLSRRVLGSARLCLAPGTVPRVGDRTGRRAAREAVAAYHQARLDELVGYVASAIDGWRAGSLDAHDVDEVLHHYQRAARELWKFCWSTGSGSHVEFIAHQLRQMADENQVIDWWDRGTPLRRTTGG